MADSQSTKVEKSEREVVVTRVFDAPPELVWKVWTEKEHVAKWWGPNGFRTTTHSMDVRPGGEWRYVMHGPDGTDYDNKITFLEVDKPRRLVYKHGGDVDCEPVNFHVTTTFEEQAGKTKLTMRMQFPSAAALNHVVEKYGAIEGAKQHTARLAEYLASLGGERGGRPFVISRVFDAPREQVYQAWTQREQLMGWFGPKGFTMSFSTLELSPGGSFLYCLKAPNGGEIWGKWVFREIVEPRRLVFVSSFSDEQGNLTRHPMAPVWPLETLTTISFEPHAGKGGGTVVTVTALPINASDDERGTFEGAFDSMTQGWGGTLDKLVGQLAGRK